MDPLAKGCFVGLTVRHGQGHMARAIMEGVAFALCQILETMLALGAPPEQILAAGNGFSSPVWRQIVADVLARPLHHRTDPERTGVGAALLAGVGAGMFDGYDALEPMLPAVSAVTEPNPSHVDYYAERYQQFCQLYPTLKPIMHELN
jgi:xylulokinase